MPTWEAAFFIFLIVTLFDLKPENVRLDTLFRLLSALDMELHVVPKGQSLPSVDDEKGWTEQW